MVKKMIYVLYNPYANNKKGEAGARELENKFESGALTFLDMTKIEDKKAFFAGLNESDEVILAGGDGTINHLANDLYGEEIKCRLWFYPCGSGNDFIRDVKEFTDKGLADIKGYIQDLPVAHVNGKTIHFLNNVAFGIDGYCCEMGDLHRAVSAKKVNYTKIALKGLLYDFKPKKGRVIVDGVTKEYDKIWMAPTMNGRFIGGGMMVAPMQDRLNKDKTLTLCVVHDCTKWKILSVFLTVFNGTHVKQKRVVDFYTVHNEVTVEFDEPCASQIDGETIKNVMSYTVKVR